MGIMRLPHGLSWTRGELCCVRETAQRSYDGWPEPVCSVYWFFDQRQGTGWGGIQSPNSGRITVEGVDGMEMHVDHQLHLVSIWLPNDEKDVAILEPVYRQYKGTKYRVAVFRSGREDLLNNTAKLLKINKQ